MLPVFVQDDFPDDCDPDLDRIWEPRPATKLIASDGEASDQFGWSVAVDGDTVVVGVPRADDNGGFSGSVYVFRLGDPQQLARLISGGSIASSP